MEPSREYRPGHGSAVVELLDGPANPHQDRTGDNWSAWKTLAIVGAAIALSFGLLLAPSIGEAQAGRLHLADAHLADPFEIHWTALEGQEDPSAPYVRPLPMASVDPPCIGFGRLDWPEAQRQPSVAHCIDAEIVDRLSGGGVALVRQIMAGSDSWYLLLFGDRIAELDVTIGDSSALGRGRLYRTGPFAAILVPNHVERFSVTWVLAPGGRYRCSFEQRPADVQTCQ